MPEQTKYNTNHPSHPYGYLLTLVQELQWVLEKKHQDAAFVSRFLHNSGDTILYYAENVSEVYQEELHQLAQTLKTMSQGFGQARFIIFPPLPLSEAKVKELNGQLAKIEADILSRLERSFNIIRLLVASNPTTTTGASSEISISQDVMEEDYFQALADLLTQL